MTIDSIMIDEKDGKIRVTEDTLFKRSKEYRFESVKDLMDYISNSKPREVILCGLSEKYLNTYLNYYGKTKKS